MAIKLDKFKGSINFKKDSPDKIKKVLNSLKEYLDSYREDEASQIIEGLMGNAQTSNEKALSNQFLKDYQKRTEEIRGISKTLRRIQEDLIDEQGKKAEKVKATKWTSKNNGINPGNPGNSRVKKDKEAIKKDPLGWLKEALFSTLLGGLVGRLLKPLKWILGGLFAAGKWGFKLVAATAGTILKSAVGLAMKAGGILFKPVTDFAEKVWDSKFGPKVDAVKESISKKVDSIKSSLSDLKNGAKNVAGKVKDGGGALYAKIGDFFGKAASNVKNAGSSFQSLGKSLASKTAKNVKSLASKGQAAAKGAITGLSKTAKKQWDLLKTKALSIGKKITNYFNKTGGKKGASVVARKLSMRLPAAMGKFAAKFVPGLGMALLAYDVYAAAKKSNSIVSFVVNLVDGVTGGLIGLGLSAMVDDFDGENLGAYVETLIKGSNLGMTSDEMNIMDGIDLNAMENAGSSITNVLNNINSLGFDGSPESLSALEKSLENNPKKKAILNEYKRLAALKANGAITDNEAKSKFKSFIQSSLSGSPGSSGSSGVQTQGLVDPLTGIEMNGSGDPVAVKNSDTNLEAYDAIGATQVQAGMITMKTSADLAAQVAGMISSGTAAAQTNMMANMGGNPEPQLQTVIQG